MKKLEWTLIGLVAALALTLAGVFAGWIWPIGILVVGTLLALNIYYVFAPRGLFVTIVPEGQAKAIMRMGEFEKFLIQWKGRTFSYQEQGDEKWTVKDGEEFHLFGGLRWVGIPPFWRIYDYKFSWTGIDVNGELVPHKEEWLNYVLLLDDVYWAKIDMAEDENLLPLDIELLITMRVVNPYKALFRVQNWSEMVMNRMKPLFREYVGNVGFDELIKKKQEKGGELFRTLQGWRKDEQGQEIYDEKRDLPKEFKKEYGVEIKDGGIEIKDANPTTIPGIPSLREVTLRKQIAERDRERILVEADAEKQKVLILADAEKQRIATIYGAVKEMGDLGKLVRTLEMFEKSPEKGTRWVINLPGGISDILSQAFPGRTIGVPSPEGGIKITPEELKALREELVKMEPQVEAYAKRIEEEARKAGIITS
jgi:hypothetical protein